MSRPRLLLTTDAVGGVWTYSLDLAAALASQADIVTLLAVLGPAPSAEQLTAAAAVPGLQVIDTGLPLDWTAADEPTVRDAAASLGELAQAAAVDLVQLHAPALACADYPVPLVSVVHSCVATWWAAMRGGPLPADLAWRSALTREGLRRSDLVVAPSHAFAVAVRDCYRLAQVPIAVPNGRAPVALSPANDRGPFALTTGRLWDEGKNVAAFDEAARLSELPFVAAGSLAGPNGAAVSLNHAQALGHVDQAELADLLAQRPIFISAARYEPFGLGVLEAAQAGCPLVLSRIPTFRELWDGAALFADSPAEIAAAVARLADPAEARRLGDAARDRSGRFTAAAMGAAMHDLHQRLLRRDRRAAA